jgi:hypothetical protein
MFTTILFHMLNGLRFKQRRNVSVLVPRAYNVDRARYKRDDLWDSRNFAVMTLAVDF